MKRIQCIEEIFDYISGLEAIIFDLDDTLYGEKEYVMSGYKAVSKLLPQVVDAEQKMWKLFEEKKKVIDELLISEQIYTPELKQCCIEEYRRHQPQIKMYNGVKETLQKLRADGYLLGIITDGRPEGQQAKLKALKLAEFVDCIIITDELGGVEFRKPNEKAFCEMQKKLNVPFEKMAYVGDNTTKDFVAPQKLGMKSIWFLNPDGIYYSVE